MTEPRRRVSLRVVALGHAVPTFSARAGGGRVGKSVEQLDGEDAVRRDAARTATRCALCAWSHEGTAGEGRSAAAEHRRREHPEVAGKPARPTGPGLHRFKRRRRP